MARGTHKFIIHLKSDKKLVYYPDDCDGSYNSWFEYMKNDDGCVAFGGKYVVPKREVEYVEAIEL